MPAARCRPHRGHAERSRHPLRRDQPGWRQRGVALRDHVLRARPDGKLHQTAQDPASFRPHQLPLTARQSGAARAAHRRLLAVAEGPRQHPETAAARHRRVQDHSDALDQDRRADYRNRLAGPCRLRRRLPRSQSVQRPRPLLPTRGTMTAGACAPEYATSQQPQRLPSLVRFRDEKGAWGRSTCDDQIGVTVTSRSGEGAMAMTYFVGLDVSVKETAVCVVDDTGKVVCERKLPTEPDDIVALLTSIGGDYGRVGIEAGPLSQWLVNGLTAALLPVVCVETRHMMALLKA